MFIRNTFAMREWAIWPNGDSRRPLAIEKKESYYHGFHDTPNVYCRCCAWEQAI
jgi:hypothetical protein